MRLFGLIGYPLSHSFSKKYFEDKFKREGLADCRYELFPLRSIDRSERNSQREPGS
jgi:shikimate dehydrogenase